MFLEVRPNLGCASELVLDRKVGLYRFDSAGECLSACNVTSKATRPPVIELIRTLPKPDFCDVVDHSPNQRCCSEVWQGYPTVIFPSRWADSQLPSSLIIKLGRATVDPRTSRSRCFKEYVYKRGSRLPGPGPWRMHRYTSVHAPRSERHRIASGYPVSAEIPPEGHGEQDAPDP